MYMSFPSRFLKQASLCLLCLLGIALQSAAQRPADTPANTKPGLEYHYYEGNWDSLPEFSLKTPSLEGTATKPHPYYRLRENAYGLTFTGYVEVPSTGEYTFYLKSDDGSRLWIGEELVVDNDGKHGPREISGSISLEAGIHQVSIHYFERGGNETLQVSFEGPTFSKRTVPATAWAHEVPLPPEPVDPEPTPEPDPEIDPAVVYRSSDIPVAPESGLEYKYYEGSWSVLPDFTNEVPVSEGVASTPDPFYRSVEEDYGITFMGYIEVPEKGEYTFYLDSDDGSCLWIGDSLVVNNDGLHEATEASGTIGLEAGYHAISIQYFQNTGSVHLEVSYESSGISKQIIPENAWSHEAGDIPTLPGDCTGSDGQRCPDMPQSPQPGLAFEYFEGSWSILPDFTVLTPVSTGIADTPHPGYGLLEDGYGLVFSGYVEVPASGDYTFYVNSDDGSRLWIGDTLVVDNDGLHGQTEVSGTISLMAGYHEVSVQYFERGGGEVLQVSYEGPGIAKQVIAGSAWSHEAITGTPEPDPEPDPDPVPDPDPDTQPKPESRFAPQPGLVFEYYEGNWTSIPEFTTLTPVSRGVARTPNSDYRLREDLYGLAFTGYIDIQTAGDYTFYLNSDDGSRLWISGTLVVDNDALGGPHEKAGTVSLEAGFHEVMIDYFESSGSELLQVSYEGPGISKQTIPESAWSHEAVGIQFPSDFYNPNATLVPLSQAANLQTLLDQHSIVLLESGDYSVNGPSQLILSSGQQVYGLPGAVTPGILIPSGTTDLVVSYIQAKGGITFGSGSKPIARNHFRGMQVTSFNGKDMVLEDNLFVSGVNCKINFDCSNNGYIRNNRFIRFMASSSWPQLVFHGNPNSTEDSYGNTFLWLNFLTPHGYASSIRDIEDLTFIAVDAESWNWKDYDDRALIYTENMGTLRLFGTQGGNHLSEDRLTPLIESKANEILMFDVNTANSNQLTDPNIVFGAGNVSSLGVMNKSYSTRSMESQVSRFNISEGNGDDVQLNGSKVSAALDATQAEALRTMIRPNLRKGMPWEAPRHGGIPDPAGKYWKQGLANQPDHTSWLQNRIDTEGIVHLEPGTYYISAPLKILDNHGIVGSGMGETVIIAKTADFDMFTTPVATGNHFVVLCNLTVQGGYNGLALNQPGLVHTRFSLAFVQFRDMVNSGIVIDTTYSLDNNFMDHLYFVKCLNGILQLTDPNYAGGNTPTNSFMDKSFWYRCQFIECGIPLNLPAKRANNLNVYHECLFEGSTEKIYHLYNNLTTHFTNCDFIDNAGEPTQNYNSRFVNCYFRNGPTTTGYGNAGNIFAGCIFDANGNNSSIISGSTKGRSLFMNCSGDQPLGTLTDAILLNNSLPDVNARSIIYVDGQRTTLDSEAADPQPQMLWGVEQFYELPAWDQ